MATPIQLGCFLLATTVCDIDRQSYVDALKQSGCADWAVAYLTLELARFSGTADERADLEFEIATARIESLANAVDRSQQSRDLESARAALTEFVRKHPTNRRVGEAKAELAQIKLIAAQTQSLFAQLSHSIEEGESLAAKARTEFESATAEFTAAADELERQYREMPLFVPEKQVEVRTQKARLFEKFIDARFQAALAQYYRADTYRTDDWESTHGSEDAAKRNKVNRERHREALAAARKGFQALHDNHRRELVGLYSHLWVARCLAEAGEHRQASGIFDQLLKHESRELAKLKRDAFHFRLASTVARGEAEQAIAQGEAWLRDNARFSSEAAYRGVQWQLARAMIAAETNGETAKARPSLRATAVKILEQLAATPNPYTALARREQLRLANGADANWTTRGLGQATSLANAQLAAAERQTNVEAKRAALQRIAKSLHAAIRVAREADNDESLQEARLALADAKMRLGELSQAAILADWICTRHSKSPAAPSAGRFAVELWAMVYDRATSANGPDAAATAADAAARVRKLVSFMVDKWAGSKEASNAILALGKIEIAQRKYAIAIETLDRMPPHFSQEPAALSVAGLARWEAYKASTNSDSSLPASKRDAMRSAAIERLRAAWKADKSANNRLGRFHFVNNLALCEANLDAGNAESAFAAAAPLIDAIDAKTADVEPTLIVAALSLGLQAAARRHDAPACERMLALADNTKGINALQLTAAIVEQFRERLLAMQKQGDEAAMREAKSSLAKLLERLVDGSHKLSPSHRLAVATAFLAAGDTVRAAELAKAVVESNQARNDSAFADSAALVLARAQLAAGELADARAEVDRLYAKQRTSRDVIALRGEILEQQGDFRSALAHWKDVVTRLQRLRPRPLDFYLAIDRIAAIAHKLEGPDRAKGLALARSLIAFVLQTDADMPTERRDHYRNDLKRLDALANP